MRIKNGAFLTKLISCTHKPVTTLLFCLVVALVLLLRTSSQRVRCAPKRLLVCFRRRCCRTLRCLSNWMLD